MLALLVSRKIAPATQNDLDPGIFALAFALLRSFRNRTRDGGRKAMPHYRLP